MRMDFSFAGQSSMNPMWSFIFRLTDRLSTDKDGSKAYYEVRLKKGRFTADADGRIYSGGQEVTWEQFETAVKSKKDDEYIQLSLPPIEPPAFAARVRELKEKHHFYYRL